MHGTQELYRDIGTAYLETAEIECGADDRGDGKSHEEKENKMLGPAAGKASPSSNENSHDKGVTLSAHPKFEKYFKMLKMNVPKPAVQHRMKVPYLRVCCYYQSPCFSHYLQEL